MPKRKQDFSAVAFLRSCPHGTTITLERHSDPSLAADFLDAARSLGFDRITYDDGIVLRYDMENLAIYLRQTVTEGFEDLSIPDGGSDQIFAVALDFAPSAKRVYVRVTNLVVGKRLGG